MSSLSRLGLGLYELLPDYRDRCPLCRGRDCAVRHGLYYRRVVDLEGRTYPRFPVVRFRCRRRGPDAAQDVTFSVLPALLIPCRRFSLGLVTWIVHLLVEQKRSLRQVLDEVARASRRSPQPLLLEEVTLYRLLGLFAALHARLLSFPVPGVNLSADLETPREQAREVAAVLAPASRGSPVERVMSFHLHYFPHLLLDLRGTSGSPSI